jgi:hypothetical protein
MLKLLKLLKLKFDDNHCDYYSLIKKKKKTRAAKFEFGDVKDPLVSP